MFVNFGSTTNAFWADSPKTKTRSLVSIIAVITLLFLGACGGGSQQNSVTPPPPPPPPAKYTIGGTVSGLSGTGLILQNNSSDNLAVSGNGAFTFATSIASGTGYSVSVMTQPSAPTQSCTVTNGSGNVGGANVTNVQVACTTSVSMCVAPLPINPVVNACASSTPQSGCIDSTFGQNGEGLLLDAALSATGAVRLQAQADGTQKVIVIDQTGTSATVVRFNLDGSLDSTFGSGGVSSYQLEPSGTIVGVADGFIDANRNILVVGIAGSDLYVMRFLPDGGVDASFGTNGVFMYQAAFGRALTIQPDGKIIAVGSGPNNAALILRLTSSGSLDSTFGSGGVVSFVPSGTTPGPTFSAYSVAIETVGLTNYIVAGGSGWLGRWMPSGTLDSSFGSGGGAVGPSCGGTGNLLALSADASGNIFTWGLSDAGVSNGPSTMYLAKYTAAGVLDTTFGDVSGTGHSGDTFLNVFGGISIPGSPSSLLVTTDSTGVTKLLVAGWATQTPDFFATAFPVLARYNVDGTLDTSFGGGVVVPGLGSGSARGTGAVVEPNGEIVPFITWGNYLVLTSYWP